jgi:hypothetical protein
VGRVQRGLSQRDRLISGHGLAPALAAAYRRGADQDRFMQARLGPALAAGGVTSAPAVRWVPLLAYHTPAAG